MKTAKRIMFILSITALLCCLLSVVVFAAGSGDVAGAVESTWTAASGQIKSVVNKVVFPAIDMILAIFFFVKLGTAYFDYRKTGQFEWTAPAILFACLVFTLTAPLYIGLLSGYEWEIALLVGGTVFACSGGDELFIWDFVADKILGQIVDWFYSQVVGFLGNFFSEMGSMGAELFEMNWVQSVVLFFSYLGWALFATGLVVAVFECGMEYSAGRGNVKETALNVLKGFLAVSLFTQVPVRLYSLAISLQGTLTAGITGFGSTSIGDAAKAALADLENLESLTESTYPLRGFGRETSGLMVLFCLILMAYAVIKVFFSNLKRGGILLIQIAVGSLYMFSVPRGYGDGFIQWCKQVIGLCLTAFLQATILVAGLMVFKDHALLGLGLMLSAGEIPRIAGAFGLDTTTKANLTSAVYTAQSAVNIARTVAAK